MSAGFLELPSWGRGSHRFFVGYDAPSDTWLKLDIVSRLAFGPHAEFETSIGADRLARTVAHDQVPLLHPSDRFWALLLHVLLDRSDIPAGHRTSLLALADMPESSVLADWFEAHAPAEWTRSKVVEAVRDGQWASLSTLAIAMRTLLSQRDRGAGRRRVFRAVVRRMTKVRKFLAEPGISVALLGPDGAGKSTLAKSLASALPFPVVTMYVGLYGASADGRRPRSLVGRITRQWGAVVRGTLHRRRGRIVVFDRWAYDARMHGAGPVGIRRRLRRWLLTDAVPDPDLVILLDAPAALLARRKSEHDVETLEDQRREYRRVISSVPHAHILAADADPDAVRRAATELVWSRLRERRGGARRER